MNLERNGCLLFLENTEVSAEQDNHDDVIGSAYEACSGGHCLEYNRVRVGEDIAHVGN